MEASALQCFAQVVARGSMHAESFHHSAALGSAPSIHVCTP